MATFNPDAFRVAYQTLSQGTPVLNNAIQMYGQLPALAYEKRMKEQEQEYQRGLDAEKMEMAREAQRTNIMDKHLQNALQLVKLAGPQSGLGYLDKYVPGHGISFAGFDSYGGAKFRGKSGEAINVMNGIPLQQYMDNSGTLNMDGFNYFNSLDDKAKKRFKESQKQVETAYNKGTPIWGGEVVDTKAEQPPTRPVPRGKITPDDGEIMGPGLGGKTPPAPPAPVQTAPIIPPVAPPAAPVQPTAPREFLTGPSTVLDKPAREVWNMITGPNVPAGVGDMKAEPKLYWPDPRKK